MRLRKRNQYFINHPVYEAKVRDHTLPLQKEVKVTKESENVEEKNKYETSFEVFQDYINVFAYCNIIIKIPSKLY